MVVVVMVMLKVMIIIIMMMMMMLVMVVLMTLKKVAIIVMMKAIMPPAVCSSTSVTSTSPFLCLDIVYVCVLLEDLGFPPQKTFKVSTLRSGCGPGMEPPPPPASDHTPLFCSWPGPSVGWRPAGLWAPPSTMSCHCTRPEVTFDPFAASEYLQTKTGANNETRPAANQMEAFILPLDPIRAYSLVRGV